MIAFSETYFVSDVGIQSDISYQRSSEAPKPSAPPAPQRQANNIPPPPPPPPMSNSPSMLDEINSLKLRQAPHAARKPSSPLPQQQQHNYADDTANGYMHSGDEMENGNDYEYEKHKSQRPRLDIIRRRAFVLLIDS
ncbi:unnamed protein product [Anisakis simplex]|uniref:Uncharacterized protein n=1 Tax=Anisakis simplex TaxID=6269 RepID=A0A0M3K502_ANISI|nr:unnamed protein product [Anisakis simplex]